MAPSPNIQIAQVLVAFNNNCLDDPGAITTIASPAGTLGGVNVWTDISRFARAYTSGRGRQHELRAFDAGQATVELVNFDGRFNSWNSTGPYFGKLLPRTIIQINTVWNGVTYQRFTGYVTSWQAEWPDEVSQYMRVSAVDGLGILNGTTFAGTPFNDAVLADSPTLYLPCYDSGTTGTVFSFAPALFPRVGPYATVVFGTSGGNPVIPSYQQTGPLLMERNYGVNLGPVGTVIAPQTGTYLQVAPSAGIVGDQAFTVEMWFNLGGASPNNVVALALQGNTNAGVNYNAWDIYYAGGIVNFRWTGASGTFVQATWNLAGVTGLWHHLVCTYDLTTMRLYGDGILQGTATPGFTRNIPAGYPVYFGGEANPSGSWAGGVTFSNIATYVGSVLSAARVTAHYYAGVGFGIEGTGSRITNTLAKANWPAGATAIDTGQQVCQLNTEFLYNTPVLGYLQRVEQTEEGALFAAANGKLTFLARPTVATAVNYGTIAAWLSDTAAAAPTAGQWGSSNQWGVVTWGTRPAYLRYRPGTAPANDELDIVNRANVTRVGGAQQTVVDSTSQARYGTKDQTVSNVLHLTDGVSLKHAQWILGKRAQPQTRLTQLKLSLFDHMGNPNALFPQILQLDLLWRVYIERTIQAAGFANTANIEKIEDSVDENGFNVTLTLSTTDTYPVWEWDFDTD